MSVGGIDVVWLLLGHNSCCAPFCARACIFYRTHCTAPHCTTPHCTALHCTALHCTALHRTVLHRTVPHRTRAVQATPFVSALQEYYSPQLIEDYYRSNKGGSKVRGCVCVRARGALVRGWVVARARWEGVEGGGRMKETYQNNRNQVKRTHIVLAALASYRRQLRRT